MSYSSFVLGILAAIGLASAAMMLATHAYLSRRHRGSIAQLAIDCGRQLDIAKAKLVAMQSAVDESTSQIGHLEQENGWLNDQLDKRPYVVNKVYGILTVGISRTGKTSITLKWANPLFDLGKVEGTQKERYERTVSQVRQRDEQVVTQHVFEIRDWGGEHIVDAQQELITEEVHGLLVVVDLGSEGATAVEPERIATQLRQFQYEALQYFFGSKVLSTCKTVVLFINKSDLLSGTPAEVEAQAMAYYKPLIDNLMRYSTRVDVRVLVGSASYGHSTHHLFAHFVSKILPRSAYDPQLLQRMQQEVERKDGGAAHAAKNGAPLTLGHNGFNSAAGGDFSEGDYNAASNGAGEALGFETTVPLRG